MVDLKWCEKVYVSTVMKRGLEKEKLFQMHYMEDFLPISDI